jgi:hypothetical protein
MIIMIQDKKRKDIENIGGLYTSKASEKSLAKRWLTKEEDKAWKHLEKEIIRE